MIENIKPGDRLTVDGLSLVALTGAAVLDWFDPPMVRVIARRGRSRDVLVMLPPGTNVSE